MSPWHADERCATAVLVGVLLPALLAASALGVSVAALGAGERELQRSADTGALAGAARMPLADSGELAATGTFELPNTGSAIDTAETFCADNLDDARMTHAFGSGAPTCEADVQPDDPSLLDTLTGAVNDLADDASLLDELGLSGEDELDPAAIAPALAHPRVRVVAGDTYTPPLVELLNAGEVDADAEGTARRRIKNAVLVPVVDLEAACDGGLLGVVTGSLADLLADSDDLPVDVADIVDDCTVDANPVLDMTGDAVFDQLEDLKGPLDAAGLPGTELVDALMLDLRDVYDPDGDAPTQREVLEEAVDGNEDVFVLVTGATDATAIPILDAVHAPAGAVRDWLEDDAASIDGVYDVATTTAEARGLFRATLVE